MDKQSKYRLAVSTLIEPLVNSWSAWSYLISPVAASLYLMNYQTKTLRSYLKNPAYHVQASHDPALVGGPFVDIPVDRADEVRDLLAMTEVRQRENIKLARSIKEFHNWLVDEARGQSLEPLYERIPDILRGYVELVYDYYNRPTVRVFERLLYKSKYYDESLQSLRISSFSRDNSRPFFMSTPRLIDDGQIDWKVAFSAPIIDELFRLDNEPQPLDYIREVIGLPHTANKSLLPFLSEGPASTPDRWREQQARIRYFGHACALIEWQNTSVLTDPFIGAVPTAGGIDRFTYQDLPRRIDYVLVTHGHNDHFVIEALLRVRHKTDCLVVPRSYGMLHGDVSLKLMAEQLGFKNVVELEAFEAVSFPGGQIIAIPFLGEHADLAHGKVGYVVRAGREQIMFGADSNCLDKRVYQEVRNHLGPIQTVFLGTECVGAPLTWVYGTMFLSPQEYNHNQERRLNGADSKSALSILQAVGASRVYNYAMGQEPWLEHIMALALSDDSPQIRESNKLLSEARAKGLEAAERLFGKAEIRLNSSPPCERNTTPLGAIQRPEHSAPKPTFPETNDVDDQFSF